jgi:hypothetical protein
MMKVMTEKQIENRKRFLQRQAQELIRAENDLKINKALAKIRDIYIGRIGKSFDPALSQKIDCATYLLEN